MRGRPRKGRVIVSVDRGTSETRESLAATCGYPLAWLLSRQAITQEHHDTGIRFAALHLRVWGTFSVRSNLGVLVERGTVPIGSPLIDAGVKSDAEREIMLRQALVALGGDQAVVIDVAVYDETPPSSRYPALRRGLDALAEHWKHSR